MSRSNSKRFRELEERVRFLEEVNRFNVDSLEMAASLGDFQTSINKHKEPAAILEETCTRVRSLVPFHTVVFYLIDDVTSDFRLMHLDPPHVRGAVEEEMDFLIENGSVAWALRERRPVIVSSRDYSSQLLLHVMATSSKVRGMFLGMFRDTGHEVPDISLSLLSIVLLSSANALESFELYQMVHEININLEKTVQERTKQLQHQALHDPLTHLPNRALIFDRLKNEIARSCRTNARVAFLLLDLDRFKEINDTLGHAAGDELLAKVGTRLQSVVRNSDTVARLGGDEFAVLLPEICSEENALDIAHRMVRSLEEPFFVSNRYIDVTASIGISLFPTHGQDQNTIVSRADIAMYAAKRSGCRCAVYDPVQDEPDANLPSLGELRQAIDENRLKLYYQPKIDLSSNHCCGVEALLRWAHPTKGLISPTVFIPLAEQGGLIYRLTYKVLQMALEQHQMWRESGWEIPVAVNLSPRNLQDPELIAEVSRLLGQFDVPSGALEIEITESAVMVNPTRALQVMRRLTEMGVSLSIDDFGSGYTSLAYLKQMPVNAIKIDLEFIINMHSDENDAIIVNSIIDLGHNLGLRVIAEGVEQPEALEMLKDFQCDIAQGYHFSPPMPPDEFAKWFTTQRAVGQVVRPFAAHSRTTG